MRARGRSGVLGARIGDNVAGQVVFGECRDRQALSDALEEAAQGFSAAVIDIAVARTDAGLLHRHLQVDSQLTIGPDHDVGADSIERGNVAARIGDGAVGGVVDHEFVELTPGSRSKALTERSAIAGGEPGRRRDGAARGEVQPAALGRGKCAALVQTDAARGCALLLVERRHGWKTLRAEKGQRLRGRGRVGERAHPGGMGGNVGNRG